jgi:ferredoxin
LDLSSNNITEINPNFLYIIDNLDVLNVSFNPAVCGEYISEDKCNEFWFWCRSRCDRCVAKCNVQAVNTEQEGSGWKEVSVSERNFTTATDEIGITNEKDEQKIRNPFAEVDCGSLFIYS